MSNILDRLFPFAGLTVDERRKRIFLSLCIFVTVPVAAIFGIFDLLEGRSVEGALIVGMGALLTTILFLFRMVADMTNVYRCCGVLVFLLMTYELAIGGGEGYAFVWFYFFPIALFFIFGRKEGLVWVAGSLGVIAAILFIDFGDYPYNLGVSIRFALTYFIVAVISLALELSRDHYYRELLSEKKALEQAMLRVKTLSGLLPVCAHCKKIRDDRGYWQQIEAYIAAHSNADISHGICPECAAKYYPEYDIYDENKEGGRPKL
jgi:hypothetical protein